MFEIEYYYCRSLSLLSLSLQWMHGTPSDWLKMYIYTWLWLLFTETALHRLANGCLLWGLTINWHSKIGDGERVLGVTGKSTQSKYSLRWSMFILNEYLHYLSCDTRQLNLFEQFCLQKINEDLGIMGCTLKAWPESTKPATDRHETSIMLGVQYLVLSNLHVTHRSNMSCPIPTIALP